MAEVPEKLTDPLIVAEEGGPSELCKRQPRVRRTVEPPAIIASLTHPKPSANAVAARGQKPRVNPTHSRACLHTRRVLHTPPAMPPPPGCPPPRGVVVGRYRQGLNGAMNDPDPSRQVAEHEGLTGEQVAELRREWGENALPEKGKSKLVLLLNPSLSPNPPSLTDPPPLRFPTHY